MALVTYTGTGINVDPEIIIELRKEVETVKNQNARLRKEMKKYTKTKAKTPKAKTPKAKTSKAKSTTDKIVGYVSSNEDYYRLAVYQNSKGRYVKDDNKRVNANRFKISKKKPKW